VRLKWSLVRQLKSKNHKKLIDSALYWCAKILAHQTPFRAHQSPFEMHHQGGIAFTSFGVPQMGGVPKKKQAKLPAAA